MNQVIVRILIEEDVGCAVLGKLAASPGDYRLRMIVEPRSVASNIAPDPEDPWDKWPDHIFIA